VYEPRRLSAVAEQLDKISEGYISNLLRRGDLEGKPGQMLLLHHVPNVLSERVLLVGCGKERELDERQYRQIIAKTISTLNETGSMEAVCFLSELHVKGRDTYWKVRHAVETTQDCLYVFDKLKSKKDETRRPLRKIVFNVPTRRDLTIGEKAVEQGLAVAAGIKKAKDVGNMPPNICTPVYLAEQTKKLTELSDKVSVEVLGVPEMAALGMNSYLAVGRGSENPPAMAVVNYRGGPDNSAPGSLRARARAALRLCHAPAPLQSPALGRPAREHPRLRHLLRPPVAPAPLRGHPDPHRGHRGQRRTTLAMGRPAADGRLVGLFRDAARAPLRRVRS